MRGAVTPRPSLRPWRYAAGSPDVERGPHAVFDGRDAQEHTHGRSDSPGTSDDAAHILRGHFELELDFARAGPLGNADFGRVVDQRFRHVLDQALHRVRAPWGHAVLKPRPRVPQPPPRRGPAPPSPSGGAWC